MDKRFVILWASGMPDIVRNLDRITLSYAETEQEKEEVYSFEKQSEIGQILDLRVWGNINAPIIRRIE